MFPLLAFYVVLFHYLSGNGPRAAKTQRTYFQSNELYQVSGESCATCCGCMCRRCMKNQPSLFLPTGPRCLSRSQRVTRSVFSFITPLIPVFLFTCCITVAVIAPCSGISYPVSLSLAGRGQLLLPGWGLAAGDSAVQRGDQRRPLRSG